ncbi:hypothetical protein [Streptococcus canis]|uniref:DUF3098 domain-containing protein n=1 Tax=Streptococcus canis FSL Z3-227 TaxID=482234 RepID=A0AAV3FUR5_STRCB|nr:hypothetical protein [Streptococcus canis]EIQ82687.1 hypothetical protein SCAZ3_10010 [Streptococcus canis FSL Z3-227]
MSKFKLAGNIFMVLGALLLFLGLSLALNNMTSGREPVADFILVVIGLMSLGLGVLLHSVLNYIK